MADDKKDVSKAAEPPKPVHIGGESLLDRLLPHIKKIIVGAIITAVVIMTLFQVRNCKRTNQERETEKLAIALEAGQKPIAEPGTPPDPVKNPGFANQKERAEKILAELAAQGASPGPAARASLLLDAGKLDEAIAEYRTCEKGSTIEAVLCREGLGIALETKAAAETDPAARQKGLEEALAVFVRMQPAEDGPRRAYAIYHQGRIHLMLGKRAEGKALFEKAKELTPPADLVQAIELRLLSLGAA
jgi:tetratricopeptide (TPR) repeat protein